MESPITVLVRFLTQIFCGFAVFAGVALAAYGSRYALMLYPDQKAIPPIDLLQKCERFLLALDVMIFTLFLLIAVTSTCRELLRRQAGTVAP